MFSQRSIWLLVVLLVEIYKSSQESCSSQVYPGRVDIVNASRISSRLQCDERNCTLAHSELTNGEIGSTSPEEALLEFDGQGSLTFHFRSVLILTVEVFYSTSSDSGLPQINITTMPESNADSQFPAIASRNDDCSWICNASSRRDVQGMLGNITTLTLTFNLWLHDGFKNFYLNKVIFHSCSSSPSGSDQTGATTKADTGAAAANQSLVIAASAGVLGFLLLLVAVTLMVLICVVVLRKKSTAQVYRVSLGQSQERNPYEIAMGGRMQKKEESDLFKEDFECVSHYGMQRSLPEPAADPEYATINESRKILNGLSTTPTTLTTPTASGQQQAVTNPFYAASSTCIPAKLQEPPAEQGSYMEVVENRSLAMGDVRRLKSSCSSYSLQDMHSTLLKDDLQGGAGPVSGQNRTQTLTRAFNSSSTRNIPSRTVRRNESCTAADINGTRPEPPPRPILLQRNASLRSIKSSEPYMMTRVPAKSSPLTQASMKAEEGAALMGQAKVESVESIDDVGNDNYIKV